MLACSRHAVTNVLAREPRPPGPADWNPSSARLSRDEREEIRAGIERGETYTAIAGTIGRATSTVTRDVAANGGRDSYTAWRAHQDAGQRARCPKARGIAGGAKTWQNRAWVALDGDRLGRFRVASVGLRPAVRCAGAQGTLFAHQ